MADPILNEFYYLHPDPPSSGGESPGLDFGSPDFSPVGIVISWPDDTLQGNAAGWTRLDDDTEGFVV